MIDDDELDKVLDKSKEMYGNIEYDVSTDQLVGCKVHLGKSSIGWKFLWNPQVFLIPHGHYETFQTECGKNTNCTQKIHLRFTIYIRSLRRVLQIL